MEPLEVEENRDVEGTSAKQPTDSHKDADYEDGEVSSEYPRM